MVCLLASLVFYAFYRQWVSFLFLLAVLLLPWLSLVLSLPAMFKTRVGFRCPNQVQLNTPVRTALQVQCDFPPVPVRCRVRLHNLLTDEYFRGLPGEQIPTNKCGKIVLSWERLFVYDYLGLFRRRVLQDTQAEIAVMPKPVKSKLPAEAGEAAANGWRPKPGGGFAENRELRLYRPGDNLRHIHWKLSAKTGKTIYAEPVEPVQKGYLLSLCLAGDIEKKLGQLVYVSSALLQRQQFHRIHCQTKDGAVVFSVTDQGSLERGVQEILGKRPLPGEQKLRLGQGARYHHIGGQADGE